MNLIVILGYLTIYLSSITSAKRASRVSPIENLRNTKDVKINANKLKTPKIISALFKTGGVIAYKNLKRSKKKYRTTVVSLTVSIFVFIAMFSFMNESFFMTDSYYTDYKYNVAVKGIKEYTDDEIEQLRNLDNINESYILYENMYLGKIKDKDKLSIALSPAVEISYLTTEEQESLLDYIDFNQITPSQSQAISLKEMSQNKTFTVEKMEDLLNSLVKTINEHGLSKSNINNNFPITKDIKKLENLLMQLGYKSKYYENSAMALIRNVANLRKPGIMGMPNPSGLPIYI